MAPEDEVLVVCRGGFKYKKNHRLANQRRIVNAIKELERHEGENIYGQQKLKREAERYFKDFLNDLGDISIINQ